MKDETRTLLTLLVEKVAHLRGNSYVVQLESGIQRQITLSWEQGQEFWTTRATGAVNREALESIALNLRYFLQNNEPTSLGNLGRLAETDLGLSSRWRDGVVDVRQKVNAYLDAKPDVHLILDGMTLPSRRYILYLFLYGDLAHANMDKREELHRWTSVAVLPEVLTFEFQDILLSVLMAFLDVGTLSELELGRA